MKKGGEEGAIDYQADDGHLQWESLTGNEATIND